MTLCPRTFLAAFGLLWVGVTAQDLAHALSDEGCDEFVLRATLPAQGTSTRGLKLPAALLEVLPSR